MSSKPLKLILVDDEQPSLSLLSHILKQVRPTEVIGQFQSPSEVLHQLREGKIQPEVAILDIEMPGINGLELARQMKLILPNLFVVFITGYNQYALEAFKVEALDYILKPFDPEEIDRILTRIEGYKGPDPLAVESQLPQFQIHCFGEFVVFNEKGQKVRWATKKAQELLAYLLLHSEQQVGKERIGEALWADKPESKHANNLHISLYRLRKDLASAGLDLAIQSEKGSQEGYGLSLGGVACDLLTVKNYLSSSQQEKITESRLEYHEQMAVLMEEDLFRGMDYIWCELDRLHYQNAFIELSKKLCEHYVSVQNWEKLGFVAEQLREKLPFDDQVYLWLFESYARRGQQSRLISTFQAMKTLYFQELDLHLDDDIIKNYEKWFRPTTL